MVKSSYESTLINKENDIGHLEIQMQKEINKLNETLEDNQLIEHYEVKILETDKLCEDLRNKYIDLDPDSLLDKKNIKLLENKLDKFKKINSSIKVNVIEILNYYYENKDILVGNILQEHNTLIPDYIEKTIIGYIYNYLLDSITQNMRNKLNIV